MSFVKSVFGAVLALMCAQSVLAEQHFVYPNYDPATWDVGGTSIQDACNIAQPGDEIILQSGQTYRQFGIHVPEGVTIRSSIPGSKARIRNCYEWNPSGPPPVDEYRAKKKTVFFMTSPGATIRDIEFFGSFSSDYLWNTYGGNNPLLPDEGGAIRCNIGAHGNGPCVIENCAFWYQESGRGGAIFVDGQNTYDQFEVPSHAPEIRGCTFVYCNAKTGGAIFKRNNGGMVSNCIFHTCAARIESYYSRPGTEGYGASGGAITTENCLGYEKRTYTPFNLPVGPNRVRSCLFFYNSANLGLGSAILMKSSDGIIEHNHMFSHGAYGPSTRGGTITTWGSISSVNTDYTVVQNNVILASVGNGILSFAPFPGDNMPTPRLINNRITGCSEFGIRSEGSHSTGTPWIENGWICGNGLGQVTGPYRQPDWPFDHHCETPSCNTPSNPFQFSCYNVGLLGSGGSTVPGRLVNGDFSLGQDGLAGWREFNNAYGIGEVESRDYELPETWNRGMKAFGGFWGVENYSGVAQDICWEPGGTINFGVDYVVSSADRLKSDTVELIMDGEYPQLVEGNSQNEAYAALNIYRLNPETGLEEIWYPVPTPRVTYSTPRDIEGTLSNTFTVPVEQGSEITRIEYVVVFRQFDNYDRGSVFFKNAFAEGLPCDPFCTGDLDRDYSVGIEDMLRVIDDWGAACQQGGCTGDADLSDFVDIEDLLTVVENWGCTTPNP